MKHVLRQPMLAMLALQTLPIQAAEDAVPELETTIVTANRYESSE
ncbi:MAG: hypothetical protein RLZZ09_3345, partial [Pseudomonadota bacterium]